MVLKLVVDGVLSEEIGDRERVLPVLRRLDRELTRRGEIYRGAELGGSGSGRDSGWPSLLLDVERVGELVSGDDQVGRETAVLLDRFARQGEALDVVVQVR